MGGVRVGRRRGVCTGLGKFAPLKNATWGNRSARCKSAQKVHLSRVPQCALPGHRHQPRTGRQLQTADCAPPAHLLPQYCTLLGKTRHRHRPHSGTASSPFRGCVGGEPLLVGHAWRACGFFAGVPLDGTCAGLMGGTFLSCGAAHCPSFL